MAMSNNSGLTSITGNVTTTINGTLPKPSATQTMVLASIQSANNGAAFYTVTAGKTFYCLGLVMSSTENCDVGIAYSAANKFMQYALAGQPVVNTGGVLFSAAAGTAITAYTTGAAGKYRGTIWGYEE